MQQFSKILYVGLEVRKESIAVVSAPEDCGAEVVSLGCGRWAPWRSRTSN
jgi:hypothetical protein